MRLVFFATGSYIGEGCRIAVLIGAVDAWGGGNEDLVGDEDPRDYEGVQGLQEAVAQVLGIQYGTTEDGRIGESEEGGEVVDRLAEGRDYVVLVLPDEVSRKQCDLAELARFGHLCCRFRGT